MERKVRQEGFEMGDKVVLLVIDGCGAGQMPDVPEVRSSDIGANTLGNLSKAVGGLHLPNLERMGLGNITVIQGVKPVGDKATASYGKNTLLHSGADTYAGHQEIMGTNPLNPDLILFKDSSKQVEQALKKDGYDVKKLVKGSPVLLVNDLVTVGDTVEGDPGLLYSVLGPLDVIAYEEVYKIGQTVRKAVTISRILAYGTKGITVQDILRNHVSQPTGQNGISATSLGLFNEHYIVRHLGYGVNPERQVPTILVKAGKRVSLIGKTADLVECEGAYMNPTADTKTVLNLIKSRISESDFVAGTVQESDLSGHDKDIPRYADTLRRVDKGIGEILELLGPDDVLFITADHGNDPTMMNTRRHTREYTPLLVTGDKLKSVNLGIRRTLADMGATVADIFQVESPEAGTSFWKEVT